MIGFGNMEEIDKKLIDNCERMAQNVGGNIRQLVRDGNYSVAVRELENLISDATMACYVCRMKTKNHGSMTPSAQKVEIGEPKI